MSTREWTFLSPVGFNQSDSLLGRSLLGLSLKELFRVIALAHLTSWLAPITFASRLPQPTRLPIARSRGFHRASGTIRLSDDSPGITSHFADAYRVAYPDATREPNEPSWGHAQIFRTVPSANTLIRWVNENAFASIVQARPCPTFGRPVHQRDRPLDYGPVLLLKPSRFHLAVDTLSSGCPVGQNANLGTPLGCLHCFQFRARVGGSLASFPGQRRVTAAFGYDAPHLSARGTLTLLIWALPSTHYIDLPVDDGFIEVYSGRDMIWPADESPLSVNDGLMRVPVMTGQRQYASCDCCYVLGASYSYDEFRELLLRAKITFD